MISVITPSSSLPPSSSSSSSSSPSPLHRHRAALQHVPQPYGSIPPRRKTASRPRSSSTSSLTRASPSMPSSSSSSSLPSLPTASSKKQTPSKKNPAQFASTSFRSSLDLSYFSSSPKDTMPLQPLSSSSSSALHSLFFEGPDSSRPGFWATLKAHYQSFSSAASSTSIHPRKPKTLARHRSVGSTREFYPPLALIAPNRAPVVTLDDTALILTSSADDALLSLPNLGSLSPSSLQTSGSYPASVAAMDKFKALRSDTIPLKTFTYHETPVVEVKRPIPLRVQKYAPRPTPKSLEGQPAENNNNSNKPSALQKSLEQDVLPLPRHLAAREPRSNSDYLRMMAAELCMIRSRKLIAPLKPRGTIARRKDLFQKVKSTLNVALELPREEDDHPLNNLLVGSWSSVSSTESFLSTTSSGYTTADECFE